MGVGLRSLLEPNARSGVAELAILSQVDAHDRQQTRQNRSSACQPGEARAVALLPYPALSDSLGPLRRRISTELAFAP
jgi:hypothetical protein